MPSLDVVASSLASGFFLGGILALTALGLSLVLGVMGLVNLAHGEFLVGGGYAALFLLQATGIDPLAGLLLIGVFIAAMAFPLQRYLLAPLASKGMEASLLTTFAISIVLQNLFVTAFSADSRSIERDYANVPVSLGPVTVAQIYIIGFAISIVLIGLVHLLVSRTAFGRDLRASAADPRAAAALGVDVRRVHALTFSLGAACAGMGGALIGIAFTFGPSSGATYLLLDFAIVVIGGLGSILGTLAGGIAIAMLQSIGALMLGDGYRDLVALAAFLLILAVRPTGLAGARA
jgi:branched-chain amino acid transport system permease protein